MLCLLDIVLHTITFVCFARPKIDFIDIPFTNISVAILILFYVCHTCDI